MKFLEVLLLVFIVLKLTGNIAWSWTLVLGPLWVPILIALILICLAKILGEL